ncbi:hypothetical protein FXO37_20939 [Capsicum annuum]|nr:hypothetical protein FXO37_20939 [Capsicum annuum]
MHSLTMANSTTGQSKSSTGQFLSLSSNVEFPALPSTPSTPKHKIVTILENTQISSLPIEPKQPNVEVTLTLQEGKYADLLKPSTINLPKKIEKPRVEPILIKKPTYHDGILRIIWTEEEVKRMNAIENLQYAVIDKFSDGWLDLEEL